MSRSLLSQIRTLLIVDVDSMDPAVAIRHTTPSEAFCDMTSNQAIAYFESKDKNEDLVKKAIADVRAKNSQDTFEQDVVDTLTVLLAKQVFPSLKGNVHAQTSPSVAYDTEKTVQHAKRLVQLFSDHGIPKERVCIKIPATPDSIIACQQLTELGIQTLATCLFSVPQAVAASQAGCLYVAPYFNELRVHFDKSLWKEYINAATEHPMSPVIQSIVQAFQRIGSKTLVMPASIVTASEVVGLVSLKPDHLTLSGSVLDQLAALPEVPPELFDPPRAPAFDIKVVEVDYLKKDAVMLQEALIADEDVRRRLADALTIFEEHEKMTKEHIRSFGL